MSLTSTIRPPYGSTRRAPTGSGTIERAPAKADAGSVGRMQIAPKLGRAQVPVPVRGSMYSISTGAMITGSNGAARWT